MMKTTILAAAAAVVTLATPAFANNFTVEVDAFMLDTQAGREKVYEKLERAARNECVSEFRASRRLTSISQCSDDLLDELVANLGDSRIIAMHEDYTFFADNQ